MRSFAILVVLLALATSPARANFSLGQNLFAAGDYAGARETWRPLAEAGDTRAQYSLGVIYEKGLGVARNIPKAVEWYRAAADQGYAPAIAALRAAKRQLKPAPTITPTRKPMRAPEAAPVPPEADERARIEQLVRDIMRQADLQFRGGVLEYGDVLVTKRGAGHRAEIRAVRVSGGSGNRMEVGTILLDFARDGDRYYHITPRLPDVMRMYAPGGARSEIRIAKQRSAIVWDRDLEIAVDMDATLGDVTVRDTKGRETARFGEISMTTDLVEKEGRWSGPMALRLRDVTARKRGTGGFHVGEMAIVAQVEKLDMMLYARLSRGVGSGATTADGLLRSFGRLLSGFYFSFSFGDLAAGPDEGRPARLERLEYELSLAGIDRDLASLAMRYGHRGLDGAAPMVPRHVPRDAGLTVTLDRLPIDTVLKAGVNALLEYWFFGEVASGSAVYNELRAALSEAGTELRIEDGALAAPDYLVNLAGVFAADTQALWGVSGEAGLTIAGLDAILSRFGKDAAGPKTRPGGPSLATLLRRMGRPSNDGKSMAYNITIDRRGDVLVNGESLIPLIAALAAE